MEVKTILFLILNAQTCTAIFNVSAEETSAKTATAVQQEERNSSRKAPAGRSFSIRLHYETQTYEPIEETLSNSSRSSKGAHSCNATDLNANLTISDKAVDFLKGPMVTRVMPSFYIIIILISLPLNALALVAFTCGIGAKKPAVICMSHLACVDLLFTLLLPLKIHYQLNSSDWLFGEAACRVLSAAYYFFMYCSILLIMCMSVDRLLAVAFPVVSLTWRSTRKATIICTLVWLLALVGTVPLLLMRQTFRIKNVGVTCHDALIHDDPADQLYMYLFSILSCLYYFVPLIVTLVSYSIIIYVLRTKTSQFAKLSSLSDKRRRAVIMAVAVLMVFVMCFAPTNGILLYHCFLLASESNRGVRDSSYVAYLLAVCLGSTSVFLDPVLYYYGSSQCRQKISSVFWWRWRKTTLSNSNSSTKSSYVTCEYSQPRIKM
ncbi:hypothetical protein QQF64_018012 [Cirrhinus molitorella]|uniref:Proteinase-activated receptor 1 n=2 Tax=Cirrhinus molitorella TaxID=172907 RepID=A0AA88TC07_9TELE|nr:hypothetical protein Q8A67_022284 [Cirrhinus molitorella]